MRAVDRFKVTTKQMEARLISVLEQVRFQQGIFTEQMFKSAIGF